MKATTWFCQLFLFLCAIHIGYATQRANYPIAYPWDYMASNFITDENLMLKRNAPSLSIVNPLDVLRKRLLLEMARRQMKENTRQVELNRTILKNVGKRIYRNQSTALDPHEYMTAFDSRGQEKLLTYQPHTHPNRYFIPATLIFDYMKRHSPDEYKSKAIPTPLLDKKNTPMYNVQSAGEEDIEVNVSSASESSIDDSDDDGFNIVSDGRKTFAISTITDQQ